MTDGYPDGTIARADEDMRPYNVYVKSEADAWDDDRQWWQTGSDVPTTLPASHVVLYQPNGEQ